MNNAPQAEEAPQLSVVIVNWNTYEEIFNCLKSLFAENSLITKEIIVVDNASSDGSPEKIPQEFPQVRFVANSENLGFAEGCNQGIRLSHEKFVLLLNPDTIVNETALERMVTFAEQNKRAGVVGCMLKLRNGAVQRSWYCFPNPLNFFLYHSISSLLFEPISASLLKLRASLGLSLKPRSVDWLMGSCLLIRREALDDVGLLDPEYFMYFEDTDWCRRAAQRGWKAYYLPDVSITHLHKRSSAKRRHFTLVRLFKSLLRYYKKYNSQASIGALKFVVTADMLVRFAAFEMIKLLQPARSEDINGRQAAVKEILKTYWRGDS